MNYSEIESEVSLAKSGNPESLTALLLQFKPYIFKISKSFHINNYDEYDLVQIGYIALIHAVEKYNEGSNSFSSYVYNTIKNAMRYTARGNKKHSNNLSINASIDGQSSLDFTEFFQSNEDLENDYLEHEKVVELQKIISDLKPDEFELIFLVYYNNFSLTDYASKKKLPYSQIIRKKNAVLSKIKSRLLEH